MTTTTARATAESPTSIITSSGNRFDLAHPHPADVNLSDITAALGNMNRWTGHLGRVGHCTILNHSLHVFELAHVRFFDGLPLRDLPADAIAVLAAALLHDAHEAYVGDVSRPLKLAMRRRTPPHPTLIDGRLMMWQGPFDEIEHDVQAAVFQHFGLDHQLADHSVVRTADNLSLAYEADLLYGDGTAASWGLEQGPPPKMRTSPYVTGSRFRTLVHRLTGVNE